MDELQGMKAGKEGCTVEPGIESSSPAVESGSETFAPLEGIHVLELPFS